MAQDVFIIKKPWITERATDLSKLGKYVFLVKAGAAKPEIKKAVRSLYKVDAVSVNVVNLPPKSKKFMNVKGKSGGYRKAIVTLKKGQKIDIQ